MDTPHFEFACSYMGCVWYKVRDQTGVYEIECRRSLPQCEVDISVKDPIVQRDLVEGVGLARRSYHASLPIPPAILHALNEWLQEAHARMMASVRAQPHRYGVVDETDPLFQPPRTFAAAIYVVGTGWVVTTPSEARVEAA